jgi:tRNA A-37 threonylcarbamoyl transferase component Bud32
MHDLAPTGEYDFRPLPVDDIAYRFEKDFRAGRARALDAYLEGNGPARWHLLVELIHRELELRLQAGEAALLSDYLGRYPALAHAPNDLAALLETELRFRLQAAEKPVLEEYQERYPALGVRVREAFKRVGSAPPAVPGYERLEEIAQGGMGTVYRARQVLLRRDVALKVIRRDRLTDGSQADRFRARFRREAEAVAAVSHPNVVQIFETGEADGDLFLAMELVDGPSLQKHLDTAGVLAPRAAAEMIAKAARAVAAVHAQGIIHRDLKPDNILLTAAGEPKVVDFGLARPAAVTDGQTQEGNAIGTPQYMSPEQTTSKEEPTARVDVYGLGAVLYAALTGRPPFPKASVVETLEMVRTQPVVPVRELRPEVPRDLETICRKCLEKDPGRRYESAGALADDLRRWLVGKPIVGRPVGVMERARKWVWRNPVISGAIAAVILVLAAGTSASLAFAFKAEANENAAVAERNKAVRALDAEGAARRKAEALAGSLQLDLDLRLFEEGKAELGLLRLCRTLKALPADATTLREFATVAALAWGQLMLPSFTPTDPTGDFTTEFAPDLGTAIVWTPREARLWDVGARQFRAILGGHTGGIRRIQYADSGRAVGTIDGEGVVRVWDTAAGHSLGTLRGTTDLRVKEMHLVAAMNGNLYDGFGTLRVSPDGRRVMTSPQGRVRLWDVRTSADLGALRIRDGAEPECYAEPQFSPGGRWIYTPLWGGEAKLPAVVWDAETGAVVWRRGPERVSSDTRWRLCFSPNDQILAILHDQSTRTNDDHEASQVGTKVDFLETGSWRTISDWHYVTGDPANPSWEILKFVSDEVVAVGDAVRCFLIHPGHENRLEMPYTQPMDQAGLFTQAEGEAASYLPRADRALVVTDAGRAYAVGSWEPRPPDASRRFHPGIGGQGVGGRYVLLARSIIDVAADKALPLSDGHRRICLQCRAGGPADRMIVGTGAQLWGGTEIVPVQIPVGADVGAEVLSLWAEVVTRQRLGPDGDTVPLPERDWDASRAALAAAISTPDERFLFQRAAADGVYWVRREASRIAPADRNLVDLARNPKARDPAVIDVFERLLERQPTSAHFAQARLAYTEIGALDKLDTLIRAEANREEIGRNRVWRDVALPDELLMPGREHREYELVECWARARQLSYGQTEFALSCSLYRLGRYAEALEVILRRRAVSERAVGLAAAVGLPPLSAATGLVVEVAPLTFEDVSLLLLRSMCQHELGQTAASRESLKTAGAVREALQCSPASALHRSLPAEADELINGPESRDPQRPLATGQGRPH